LYQLINLAIDKLRTDKYNLTVRQNHLQHESEDVEDKVQSYDPDFVKNLKNESEHSGLGAIEETRNLMKIYKTTKENVKEFEQKEYYNELLESETDDEEFKKMNTLEVAMKGDKYKNQ
jgi:hypothetical protein